MPFEGHIITRDSKGRKRTVKFTDPQSLLEPNVNYTQMVDQMEETDK